MNVPHVWSYWHYESSIDDLQHGQRLTIDRFSLRRWQLLAHVSILVSSTWPAKACHTPPRLVVPETRRLLRCSSKQQQTSFHVRLLHTIRQVKKKLSTKCWVIKMHRLVFMTPHTLTRVLIEGHSQPLSIRTFIIGVNLACRGDPLLITMDQSCVERSSRSVILVRIQKRLLVAPFVD